MNGITFNGKHSYNDFGLVLEEKKINPPAKTKILDTVPYMNSQYDFSTVGTNGEQVYGTRIITVKLALLCYSMEQLYIVYSQVLEWLVDVGQSQLIFDFMPDFYFLAEVQEAPSWDEFVDNGELSINFVCEPFKYSTSYMGDDLWDDINFLTDYMQDTNEFNISGSTTITMYNNGRLKAPVINCSSAMTVTFNNQTYNLVQGDNKLWGLKLRNGKNDLVFSGNGTVKILFRWEML
ncbi:distal tail protein Dit [Clostridium neuense]|uniref:Distal tail protein Dit n=1 Tax=Clostridium neuense TaxID=1728934 RepID=A0ABW8TG63_9CLOT